MKNPDELFEAYIENLARAAGCRRADGSRSDPWTRAATDALVSVGEFAYPSPRGQAAAKGRPDEYGRSEYKGHDVTIWNRLTWGPPLFVAEHDNSGTRARVQYDTWKLTTTEAETRVLVAYFGRAGDMASFKDLTECVASVACDNPGKRLLLIGGEYWGTKIDAATLRGLHRIELFGGD